MFLGPPTSLSDSTSFLIEFVLMNFLTHSVVLFIHVHTFLTGSGFAGGSGGVKSPLKPTLKLLMNSFGSVTHSPPSPSSPSPFSHQMELPKVPPA